MNNEKYAAYFPYFDTEIAEVIARAKHLFETIVRRDEHTCHLCETTKKPENLRIHTIDSDVEPSLNNSITVCNRCKVRVIDANKSGTKKFKLLFYPYLRSNHIRQFNIDNVYNKPKG